MTRRIRAWLVLFMAGLVLSGLTALPLEKELAVLARMLGFSPAPASAPESALHAWLGKVYAALVDTNRRHPFLAYGTDWLAFGHLVIAVAFIGPVRDPVRNKWVVTFGLVACAAVVPMALIAGQVRGIPVWWRLIDCGFGVFGSIPLIISRRAIRRLETLRAAVR